MGMFRGVYLACDEPDCKVDTDEWAVLRGCRHPDEIERKAKAVGWRIESAWRKDVDAFKGRHFCPTHAAKK